MHASGRLNAALDVISDPKCLGSDSQGRIHRGGRGEKGAVDHKQIWHVVAPAKGIEHRFRRINPKSYRPALMRIGLDPHALNENHWIACFF